MVKREIFDFANQHKSALIFAAGFATAVVGKKILESKVVKDTATDCVAGVMALKQDAEDRVSEIKDDAEAQLEEDDEEEKKLIEVEDEEEEKHKKSSKKSKKSKK